MTEPFNLTWVLEQAEALRRRGPSDLALQMTSDELRQMAERDQRTAAHHRDVAQIARVEGDHELADERERYCDSYLGWSIHWTQLAAAMDLREALRLAGTVPALEAPAAEARLKMSALDADT
jgi:hypothetical protein